MLIFSTFLYPPLPGYEGTVDTILRRLNSSGYTSITKNKSPSGPSRKYYGLTEDGRRYLKQMVNEWLEMVNNVIALGIPTQTA